MKKTFLVYIILASALSSYAQNKSKTIYKDSAPVGMLYNSTNIDNYKDCYILDTLNIWNKNIIVKTDAILLGIKSEESKQWFSRIFFVEFEQKDKETIIKFENAMTADCHWLYIKKDRKGNLSVFREVSFGKSTINIENENKEHTVYNSTLICTEDVRKPIVSTITPSDFFSFNEDESNKECFDSPTRYSINEALMMKKKKQKFKWE